MKTVSEENKERRNHGATYSDFPVGSEVRVVCVHQDWHFFDPDTEDLSGRVMVNTGRYLGIIVEFNHPRYLGDGNTQYQFNFAPHDLVFIPSREELDDLIVTDVGGVIAKRKSDQEELEKLQAENQKLKQTLLLIRPIAKIAFEYWDLDNDSKVGKILKALTGSLPGYMEETDQINEVVKQVQSEQNYKDVMDEILGE